MGVGSQQHAPAALPPGKTWYPLCRSLGGPQGRSERVRKISPPPGFDPRTAQPVASRYADWAIPAPNCYTSIQQMRLMCFASFYHLVKRNCRSAHSGCYTLMARDPLFITEDTLNIKIIRSNKLQSPCMKMDLVTSAAKCLGALA